MIMKSFLMVLVLVGFSISSMAALQYGMNIEKANEYVQAGRLEGFKTSEWGITALQDVTLYLNSNSDVLSSVNKHMERVVGSLTEGTFTTSHSALGYFVYDATTKAVSSIQTLDFSNDMATISLKQGETMGFWITMDDGKTYSSISGIDGFTHKFSVMGGGDLGSYDGGKDNAKVYNFGNSWYLDGSAYGYEQSFLIAVEAASSTPAPSGQPLPGILAAMAIGGSVAMYRRSRKK